MGAFPNKTFEFHFECKLKKLGFFGKKETQLQKAKEELKGKILNGVSVMDTFVADLKARKSKGFLNGLEVMYYYVYGTPDRFSTQIEIEEHAKDQAHIDNVLQLLCSGDRARVLFKVFFYQQSKSHEFMLADFVYENKLATNVCYRCNLPILQASPFAIS
jgi:hypothetical protein